MSRAFALVLLTALSGAVLVLAGCGGTSGPSAAPGTVTVVASTDVYGNLAATVGGDAVSVTSIIDDPSKDPHEYTADARAQLALSKAQVVIKNGGGYDDFVDTMLSSLSGARPTVVDVAEVSGYDQQPADGELNEHFWYDVATMITLVQRLSAAFASAAPEHAAAFRANAAALTTQLAGLEQQEATIKAAHAGAGLAITEPVPLYLLQASGLSNKTPEAFSEAIESGTDVSPIVLRDTLDLFAQRRVAMLAYNEQTSGPQTEAVQAAAKRNGIPVVGFTETLPAGQTYVSWMTGNLQAVSTALEASS